MFRDLVPFNRGRKEMESFFDRFFHNDGFMPVSSGMGMKVDIKENDNEYLVEAEIPGVDKEAIQLDYQNGYLTISVENNEEYNEERENYIRKERRSGRVSRSFYVEDINEEKIEAQYRDGILKITLPKSGEKKKKNRIEIQ
ncbi:Hsp20/alpha crystallin family protein [Alkaliphilus serpentinus]|uniref:Hsp20/alpha crystallin family protein n=1 Tax=Alkaliphilus serpentinus TaxID=1482731 RepID=A0A833HNA3_9FIRM|nr:Hsp20/alpha crystallin family protein [Alkaliphilus serpentinus]KAB3529201.1 Hsp20/alpha crystallin family protein [Alkaliphilus serpentinus]